MNKFEAVLPLVQRKRSILHKVFVWIGLLLLAASFLQVFNEGIDIFLFFLFSGILLLNMNYLIKDYRIVGSISLFWDRITVDENGQSYEFRIDDIEQLEIFLLGIRGEFYRGKAITTMSGTDNVIKFRYNGAVREILFLLDVQSLPQLSQVLSSWKESNIAFKLHNQTRAHF